jgi:hypothetical protein
MFKLADTDGRSPLPNSAGHGFDAGGRFAQVSSPEAFAESSFRR